MTLDEAIKYAEEVAKGYKKKLKVYENINEDKPLFTEEEMECKLCAEEHEQLATWLKELKKFREQQPYEKFESTKDHIYKLAGDYKCWDNRLTEDEAVELCHILEQETCEDAISRDDALKALDYDIKSFEFKSGVGRHMNEIANLLNTIYEIQSDNIKALPPVQPKPKVGHWIFDEILDRNYYCSECKSMGVDYWDYCPYCGARMVEPQESE